MSRAALRSSGVVLLAAIALCISPADANASCAGSGQYSGNGNCHNGVIDGSGVTVNAGGGGSSSGGGGGSGGGEFEVEECVPAPGQTLCRDEWGVVEVVSIDDLRHFPAAPGRAAMQPDGWTVAGLHTNFYAVVGEQEYRGPVLGRTATVRFTPIRYHWNYGDGSQAVRAVKGGTWASQGLREFARTPTSHVYRQEREYRIRLSVEFSARYRYGDSGWRPVIGTLVLPANELRIRVTGADTVLVDRDCTQAPAGPGC